MPAELPDFSTLIETNPSGLLRCCGCRFSTYGFLDQGPYQSGWTSRLLAELMSSLKAAPLTRLSSAYC